MIKISIDEGAAFDMLSILDVKEKKISGEDYFKNLKNISNLSQEIKNQIGDILFDDIKHSLEYQLLVIINEKIFNMIDETKNKDISFKLADTQNYQRYIAKANLQKKFFNNDLKEVKIGYGK